MKTNKIAAKNSKSKTTRNSKSIVAGSVGSSRSFSKKKLLVFALLFAVVGTVYKFYSSADQIDLTTSTNPNTVIVQYNLPHEIKAAYTTNITPPETPPFTLYGNGLLVCGNDNPAQFSANVQEALKRSDNHLLPTSRILTSEEIKTLVSEISNTGFFNLEKEYFNAPVSQRQSLVRVNLMNTDKYVYYYNDVPAPSSYTAVVELLKQTCSTTTTPYKSNTVTLRTLKNANPKEKTKKTLADFSGPGQSAISQNILKADESKANYRSNTGVLEPGATSPGEAVTQLSDETASALIDQMAGQTVQYIDQNGSTYEIAVSPNLPAIENQLHVDYRKIRAEKAQSSLSYKIKNSLFPRTQAEGTSSVRVVLLLPSDGGSTSELNEATFRGQSAKDWYCARIGSCYGYKGTSVIRGSQTQAYYSTCQGSDPCQGEPMAAILYNVKRMDKGTIDIDPSVATFFVPGWKLGSPDVCGYGFIGYGLGMSDFYQPTYSDVQSTGGWYCSPGKTAAHELGHNFGLNHTNDGQTLMAAPSANCEIPGYSSQPVCPLDAGQASTLKTNTQYFAGSTAPPASSTGWQPAAQVSPLNNTDQAPGVISRATNSINIFTRGTDSNVYQQSYNGTSWSSRQLLGGTTPSSPAVASWASNRMDLFVRNGSNGISWRNWNGTSWSAYENLKGGTTTAPAAVSWGSGRIDLFVRGTNNNIYQKYYSGGRWSSQYVNQGGVSASAPAVSSWGTGRLDVFIRGTDNNVYQKTYNSGSWTGFTNIGGQTLHAPTVVSKAPGTIDLFITGTDNQVYQRKFANGAWGGYEAIGHGSASAPAAASWGAGRYDVFTVSGNNVVQKTFK